MGRRRIHPKGSTSTYRMKRSKDALKKRGGRVQAFRLEAEALLALKQLLGCAKGKTTETEILTALLLDAYARLPERHGIKPGGGRRRRITTEGSLARPYASRLSDLLNIALRSGKSPSLDLRPRRRGDG